MKGKLIKVSNKFSILALLLIISCNANMNTNDKNKVLNEHNLKNISEVIKNSLQIESDLKKEPEANKNQSTPPILEIEKIEPGKQEFSLKSESESSIPLEILEGANVVKSEEEIAKIQEKLLLIGASDERIAQELDPNIQKSLNPTTIEFKILSTADEKTILDPTEEEINTNGKDKIFDQKKENSTLSETTKTPIQNQFQKHGISLSKDGNFITKEYVEQVRESLDKALNAIKSLEKSKDLFNLDAEENLLKDLGNSQNKTNSSISNNINAENIEKTKNIFLEELEKSELSFENTKDPLGISTIKEVIDAANKWKEKENSSQINWDLGSKFHPNPKLYNESVAREYKVLAEKFTKVKNEYKNTKEQLKVQSKLTANNLNKIIDATKEFANQVRNLILLVENNQ
ncbi:hypothetical protein PT136_05125 (plasmid) [Borreliella garinii]|uniref:hypothetical protein n=1 Tax=Borreliella garinii TaxID=29519 RepID=UPI0002EB52D3|nr:hypothetical protein [Borreliella garinii]WNZ67228.1 hypothetical protein PT139_05355 [Borreliella garinii]WNZ68226.1 hypothetical protein PT135_05365 [Borreliella garinii]WNZ69226.1 hypothetical protein PT138_05380 [Borreliella garinii]WNZ70226.1 hypothetical protein PT140_05360 [Borreliella garinii]WNZ71229.1 hypothetical protein PT141_05385 [Borreliella garinii]